MLLSYMVATMGFVKGAAIGVGLAFAAKQSYQQLREGRS